MTDPASLIPEPSAKGSARLKLAGRIILGAGILSAGLVYWLASRTQTDPDDPMMAGYSKVADRQLNIMYGKMGSATHDLLADLERPGALAVIILICSILVALVCFRLAEPLPAEPPDKNNGTTS